MKSKKIRDAARGQECIRCGSPDAYACHYNGEMQHWYGKGRGVKCSDLATAEFCYACDQLFSEGNNIYHDKVERSEMFLHFILMTNIRRFNNGVLKVG